MAYGRITIHEVEHGVFAIRSGYFSRALIDACKAVPGMHFDDNLGWLGYPDAIECVRDALSAKGIKVEGDIPEPDDWKSKSLLFPVATKGAGALVLRPYQQEGVKFLIQKSMEGCLLADGM